MPSKTSINCLPNEILIQVFSHLEFKQHFPRLILVNKRFNSASFDCKTLILSLSIHVYLFGLDNILSKFPLLQFLFIESNPNSNLLPKIAEQFKGHPTISRINCGSDLIINEALRSCPRLKALELPSYCCFTNDNTLNSDFHIKQTNRDVMAFFYSAPNLQVLELEDAICTFRGLSMVKNNHPCALTSLKLCSISNLSMQNLVGFFEMPENIGLLSNLKTFVLESGGINLSLPDTCIRAISNVAPNLEKFKVRDSIFYNTQMADIAYYLKSLKFLSLRECFIHIQQSDDHDSCEYIDLVLFLASNIPGLENIKLYRNILTYSNQATETKFQGDSFKSNLQSLKILDFGETKPDLFEIQLLLTAFKHLKEIRLDAPIELGLCSNGWENLQPLCENLTAMDIKFGRISRYRPTDNEKEQNSIYLPKVNKMTLMNPPVFPMILLSENCSNLVSLTIDYLYDYITRDTYPSLVFPNLNSLKLSGYDHVQLCETALALTRQSSFLSVINMTVNNSNSYTIENRVLETLCKTCPRITSFSIFNFKFDPSSFDVLIDHWPGLLELQICGSRAMGKIELEWQTKYLYPFLNAHKQLLSLVLSVGENLIPGYEIVEVDDILNDHGLISDFDIRQKCQYENVKRLNSYTSSLKNLHWWIVKLHIRGTFTKESDIHRDPFEI